MMSRANVSIAVASLVVMVALLGWTAKAPNTASNRPTQTSIAVEVDGQPRPPLTAALLAAHAWERRFEGWSVWKLEALVPGAAGEGSYVEFERSDGKWVGLRVPPHASGREPLLAMSDGGSSLVMLAQLTDGDPVPSVVRSRWTASVSRLRVKTAAAMAARQATRLPRATPVAVRTGAAEEHGGGRFASAAPGHTAQAAPQPGALTVSLGGGRSANWSFEDLRRVPRQRDIPTEGGAASGWSMRDVVAILGDNGARIGTLTNTQGQVVTISSAQWADQTRTPMLRVNHRGLWKFDWVDAGTRMPLPGGLRDVAQLTVER